MGGSLKEARGALGFGTLGGRRRALLWLQNREPVEGPLGERPIGRLLIADEGRNLALQSQPITSSLESDESSSGAMVLPTTPETAERRQKELELAYLGRPGVKRHVRCRNRRPQLPLHGALVF